MRVEYKIDDTTVLQAFLWSDIYTGDSNRRMKVVPYYNGVKGRPVNKDVFFDEPDPYFIWNREQVYIREFEYKTVDELAQMQEKGEYLFDHDIWATLIRDTDNFAIVDTVRGYDPKILLKAKKKPVNPYLNSTCIPETDDMYANHWQYKVTFKTLEEELRKTTCANTYYFSDFAQMIQTGQIKIINKADAIPTTLAEDEEEKNVLKSLFDSLRKMLKLN